MLAGNILIVEEEPALRATYSRALSRAGFAVTRAKAGREALRRLEGGAFDVLLADIQMPEKNGLALLQEIHALSPNLPVIVMVSELNSHVAGDAADRGAVQSLAKPVGEAPQNRKSRCWLEASAAASFHRLGARRRTSANPNERNQGKEPDGAGTG